MSVLRVFRKWRDEGWLMLCVWQTITRCERAND
jgi:hypothetical protein